jgi:hypothetical protein
MSRSVRRRTTVIFSIVSVVRKPHRQSVGISEEANPVCKDALNVSYPARQDE